MVDPAGFLTHHMATHIVAMNVVAPLVILTWRWAARSRPGIASPRSIMPAATIQMALLWAWHLPGPMASAFTTPGGEALMHVSLFAAAMWFWASIINEAEAARLRSLIALAFTGKLFCLLGALLTFAPRALYARAAEIRFGSPVPAEVLLPDQQLAGLLMLVACPLVYVAAGVFMAARWLHDIEKRAA
ncbi:cytochrome c oxidase assembly protein [Chelativorans sp. YIM 93263]|uniref:cytochrome c oxidase assembly protein n=1 Tax=Chelativorans sp. YIM 93263 TaxID=2906648 RepID=UPI002377D5BE|nr:cytochrome c oxidase assembly protein [Chelativorans sp. YIM 93263]